MNEASQRIQRLIEDINKKLSIMGTNPEKDEALNEILDRLGWIKIEVERLESRASM